MPRYDNDPVNKAITILTLGLQIALTFFVTFCIYMVFSFVDNDFSFDGLYGLFIFQPFFALIISGLTIVVCFVAGLPIRLNDKLNYWWTTNFYVAIIGIVLGFSCLLLSLLPFFKETVVYDLDGQPTLKQLPNSTLAILGWFLSTFSLLHIYPPKQLTEKAKKLFQRSIKALWTIILPLISTSCMNATNRTENPIILKADQEAPLGWVYLTIYKDSTFEYKLTGIRGDDEVFEGKVDIQKDSLFFAYSNEIPKAESTAVYNNKVVAYVEGAYPECVGTRNSKLRV